MFVVWLASMMHTFLKHCTAKNLFETCGALMLEVMTIPCYCMVLKIYWDGMFAIFAWNAFVFSKLNIISWPVLYSHSTVLPMAVIVLCTMPQRVRLCFFYQHRRFLNSSYSRDAPFPSISAVSWHQHTLKIVQASLLFFYGTVAKLEMVSATVLWVPE
jgi:hypothetical protein